MARIDISQCSLATLAAALRSGDISAGELHAHACSRHEHLGKRMNAYIHWAPHSAAAAARAADAAFKAGTDLGPLQGLPLNFKDHYGIEGMPTYAGSSRRLPAKFETEGAMVRAVKQQLAVITGKTHTVEFAAGGGGANPNWGTPFNPWDLHNARTPGGSSHGAAARSVGGLGAGSLQHRYHGFGAHARSHVRIGRIQTILWPLAGFRHRSIESDTGHRGCIDTDRGRCRFHIRRPRPEIRRCESALCSQSRQRDDR